MPLEPVSQGLLQQLAEERQPPISEQTPALARMTGPIFAGMSGRGPEVGAVRNVKLKGADGGLFRVRALIPEGEPEAVIVYFHGGGWVLGDIDLQYDHVGRDLANRTRSTVVLVNYRKAPEHRFPTAIEDSYLGLCWAAEHLAELATTGAPLIVAGDSAGGNIAAVMTHWARDRRGPQIDYQALVYPVTDCDVDTPSYVDPENQLMLSRDTMIWFWDHYLPDVAARTHPDASPLRAADLSGLPPALVYVCQYDPLHDEGVAYARALEKAGVPVTLAEAEGQMHIYFQMANILPGYQTGIALVADHITTFISNHAHTSAPQEEATSDA
ncbi:MULTISPECIES: alpha/beta hydrolase [Gordonia]|jgi:acetyl esterase|uniref:Alpha/beta hydrolase n=2 Tax=Gordonia TaxID=2053 RepID=A0A9X3D9Z8_9ACTN|nr:MULTISPECIES: alpha/beta hydrolase [Gordonia]MAU81960.1 esterase [Gordonia sp. (in: high G+C Gram-positive bacteria)]MCF3941133.1 alpha/beta hydrolase [Gordonia tangerina]MCX2966436.1 alpha/beta hydrolase [Gordonia aquimaris]